MGVVDTIEGGRGMASRGGYTPAVAQLVTVAAPWAVPPVGGLLHLLLRAGRRGAVRDITTVMYPSKGSLYPLAPLVIDRLMGS